MAETGGSVSSQEQVHSHGGSSVVYGSVGEAGTTARPGREGCGGTALAQHRITRASSLHTIDEYRSRNSMVQPLSSLYKSLLAVRLEALEAHRERQKARQRAEALAALPKILQL
eukprot:TRINITY_DN85704_c0_g1_i1.p2 TRINITY_DN85704_c0_g1~~TRINITY_DN85704_c0_g1_i1.p2  ORF type:complete len:114 (+),score=14.46 TRINITY_DN85704_c0_g1_i1:118-459(+)